MLSIQLKDFQLRSMCLWFPLENHVKLQDEKEDFQIHMSKKQVQGHIHKEKV